jgi:hypothetical protein
MDLKQRRRVGFLIRIALIFGTVAFVGVWALRKVPRPPENVSVQREAPTAAALGKGDIQIISTNGAVDLILQGDKIMGGLSPATVARVRADLDKSKGGDSTGFGGMIAGIVKSSVASAIGTHVTYPLSEVKEVIFEGGRLVIVIQSGERKDLGNIKTDGEEAPVRFSTTDGDRFVAAVVARKKELGIP